MAILFLVFLLIALKNSQTDSIGLRRIDKELSISNSINIGEVSGGNQTGGVVGWLDNSVDSAGIKPYSHNNSFNIINCSNMADTNTSNHSGNVVGRIFNTLSYAGITSETIANTVVNEVMVKYCFNTGDLKGSDVKGGIIGLFYNYVGTNGYNNPESEDKPIRGGKGTVDISNNRNAGNIFVTTKNNVGGIIGNLSCYVYSDNCYYKATIYNNFNSGSISNGSTGSTGGIIGYSGMNGASVTSFNVNVSFKSCYNYSININEGSVSLRGGVVGGFNGNSSRITLLNNYSAYKRDDNNNIHGTNPTTLGANVGEYK